MDIIADKNAGSPFGLWLRSKRGRVVALAKFGRCSPAHITSIAAGRSKPSAELLRSIIVFAQGELDIDDVLWPWRKDFLSVHDAQLNAAADPAPRQSKPEIGVSS